METPAAMFIESAKDSVARLDPQFKEDQLRELHEAIGDSSQDKQDGYLLGLQTARVVIFESPLLREKGVDPQQVL